MPLTEQTGGGHQTPPPLPPQGVLTPELHLDLCPVEIFTASLCVLTVVYACLMVAGL